MENARDFLFIPQQGSQAPQRLFNKTFVDFLPATSDNITLSDSFYDLTLKEKL